jgi:hypothetical protein
MQMPPDCIRVLFSRLDYFANALEPKKWGYRKKCHRPAHFAAPQSTSLQKPFPKRVILLPGWPTAELCQSPEKKLGTVTWMRPL